MRNRIAGLGHEPASKPASTTARGAPRRLQREVGNLGLQRTIQAKLHVGRIDDALEREADQIADAAMRDELAVSGTSAASVARASRTVSGSGDSVPDSFVNRLGGGTPIRADLRAVMESRLGRDFSGVRLHSGSEAANAAREVQARAFTVGRDIAFGEGELQPESTAGRHLIAHELAHVTQQGVGSSLVQRKETSSPTVPVSVAEPFVPDHAFYELLAHEVSYRGFVEGMHLFKAQQMKRSSGGGGTPLNPPSFATLTQSLPDHFALRMDAPYVSSNNPALYYTLHEEINAATGLFIVYMLPSSADAPRLVAFRGTEPTKTDIQADADPGGVGFVVFELNCRRIEKMLDKVNAEPGKGTVVTGHSLGGALAQWATVEFPSKIQETVTFNSPGISFNAAARLPIGNGTSKVSHYVTRGDVVSTAGETLIGGTITVMEGAATKQLEHLVTSGAVFDAEKTFGRLPAVIALLASDVPGLDMKLGLIVDFALTNWSGLSALADLGELLGDLHSQRLLRSSEVNQPFSGFSQAPIPHDAQQLMIETGVVKKTISSKQVTVPQIEAARAGLGTEKVFQGTLVTIFDQTIPLIKALARKPGETLKKELLQTDSPLRIIARQVYPIFGPVSKWIARAGGLAKVVELALDYHPETWEKPVRETLDALKVVPQYPLPSR